MAKVKLDKRAPEFMLQDYKGNLVSSSHYIDKQAVLLVFNRGFM